VNADARGSAKAADPSDIIGTFDDLRRALFRYYDTPFGVDDASVMKERSLLLDRDNGAWRDPLIELRPQYASSGMSISESFAEAGAHPDAADFARFALPSGVTSLYRHQHDALVAACRDAKDFVVTAGTGSGKTEAFLLPVLADLVAESASWTGTRADQSLWWQGSGDFRPSRADEPGHSAAMRALILYPTNALADDQLARLRKALDSKEARAWLDGNREGHRFYFGRYTGATPVSGSSESKPALERLRGYLQAVHERQQRAGEKVQAFVPRLGGAEMHSRWDMQATPPDIMVTNYSMLNIMLLRPQENRLFEATRQWLHSTPGACFTLVLDELHMYRGTAGTEVAYLLRNLRHRLGLDTSPEKFRVLAASASLEAGRDEGFLEDFFALPTSRRKIISGSVLLPRRGTTDLTAHATLLSAAVQRDLTRTQARSLVEATGLDGAIPHVLSPGGTPTALRTPELARRLFPGVTEAVQRDAALHGALRALGSADDPDLPKLRAHLFFRNIGGIWACSDPACPDVPAEVRAPADRQVGRLFSEPASRCTCGARVLELLYCQTCGDLMLGGYASPSDTGKRRFTGALHTDFPELDLLPDEVSGVPTAANYIVYWPRPKAPGLDDLHWTIGLAKGGQSVGFEFRRSVYQPGTGRLVNQDVGHTGWSFHISVPDDKAAKQPAIDPASLRPFPTRCPCCGDDWEIRRTRDNKHIPLENSARLRSAPVRRMRTGFDKINQVLATEALGHLPEDERKAIAFSDSRDDASELASGLALRHYQDLLRLLSAQAVREQGDPFADLQLVKSGYAREAVDPGAVKEAIGRLRGRSRDGDFEKLRSILIDDFDAEPDQLPGLEQRLAALPSLDLLSSDLEGLLVGYGTNPGGPAASLQETEEGQRWTVLFNWKQDRESIAETQAQQRLLTRIRERLRTEFLNSLFSSAGRDFESLGLGWLCLKDDRAPLDVPVGGDVALARASLRVLGQMRRFSRLRAALQNPPAPLKRFWLAIAAREGTDLAAVRDRVLGVWGKDSAVLEYVISPDKVALRNGSGKVWTCPSCRRPHLHRGAGICTKCYTDLPAEPQVFDGALDDDYYAWKAANGTGNFPLRAAELTGQTDRLEAQRRQSIFQGVFLGEDDEPEADGLELLSVTTTMEAGVDVGPLNTVLLANMPPTRFNYQQRVGRAGRRGSPVALALTVCRGRSHDEHYFARPEDITNAPTPRPYLALGMPSVFKRVLLGEVLRQAFASVAGAQSDADLSLTHNVHGQFGLSADWASHSGAVRNWTLAHPERIKAAAAALQASTPPSVSSIEPLSCVVGLLDAIDSVAGERVGHAELSQRLAEAGLLPMFGFPTRARQLYRSMPQASFPWPPPDSINRDLAVALSKFAPGSETPQDGRLLRSIGVVSLRPGARSPVAAEDPFGPEQLVAMCRICAHITALPEGTEAASRCPACSADGKNYGVLPFREPGGFRADSQPRDYDGTRDWGSGSTSARTAADLETTAPQVLRNADDWLVVHSGTGDRYIVNSNGGKLFRFRKGAAPWKGYWHLENPAAEADLVTALGATQHTDMLFLGAKRAVDPARGLRFDISRTQQRDGFADSYHGRRASWYSLAALLRRAAAPYLDVQPDELLSGIHGSTAPVAAPVMAYLADSLDNGAGFSTHLGSPEQIEGFLGAADMYIGELAERRQHAENCSSSCYTCLRDYSNMRLHPLFDWRLARDLLDVLRGRQLDVNSSRHRSLLSQWSHEDSSISVDEVGGEPVGIYSSDFSGEAVAVAVKHPLESATDECEAFRLADLRKGILAKGLAERVVFIDSYCLDRTPAAVIDQVRRFTED
jgi:ATP-dependent helicase YprA (DUF1998 family)